MLADRTRGGPGWQPWDMERVRISQYEAALAYLESADEDEGTPFPGDEGEAADAAFATTPDHLK